MQQKLVEERLRRREQELEAREIDLLERELHIIMQQTQAPTPKRRRGKFKRSRLLRQLKKEPNQISSPSGERNNLHFCRQYNMPSLK